MLPLVQIPEIVSHYSPYFKDLFTEGEYVHFQRYLSGLLVCENKAIDSINRLFVLETKDQSSLNRFLTDSSYTVEALQSKRLAFLNEHPSTCLKANGPREGVLSIDNTLLTHYGKHFAHITKLYDHVSDSYVLAHDLVNLHYSDDQTDYPISFKLWIPADLGKIERGLRAAKVKINPAKEPLKQSEPKKWRNYLLYLWRREQKQELVAQSYQSKILIAKELLKAFFADQADLNIPICFDNWFTSRILCEFIDKELKKAYVAALKSDEKLLKKGSIKINVSDFAKQLKAEHQSDAPVFKKTSIRYKKQKEVYYTYCKTHHVCGYGRVKFLVTHRKKDLSDNPRIFISNRPNWRVQQMVRVGRHRWPIEEYHKEGKAEGLDQYQTRNFKAIEKHIALVALVYSLLKHAQHDSVLLNQLQSQLNIDFEGSLAFWRRTTQAQALWVLVQWVELTLKKGVPLQEIMANLSPAFNIV